MRHTYAKGKRKQQYVVVPAYVSAQGAVVEQRKQKMRQNPREAVENKQPFVIALWITTFLMKTLT